LPSGVRTDSGWNWTPCAGSSRCCTPITTPPPVAVIISESPQQPVGLEEIADFGTGLTVRLVDIEAVDGEAQGPGQVAGPALRVSIEASNDTDDPVSLSRVQVEVSHGDDHAPGMALTGPDVERFPDVLEPGETAVSAVVFGVPPERRDAVRIWVNYTTEAPTVVFEGAVR
jgi:hypothetical protein